jgi:branched-chain amino acid transport system ATP-binding protein
VSGALLEARGLSRRFGGCSRWTASTWTCTRGGCSASSGPTGSGKSTAINLITGHLRPTTGTVTVDGRDMTGAAPWRIAHAGVARTFQIVKPFAA